MEDWEEASIKQCQSFGVKKEGKDISQIPPVQKRGQ